MLGLVSRLQPPTHSRTTRTLTDSSPVNWNVHVRPIRGLVDVVSGVVHGASGVVHDVSNVGHDVGHVVGDIITGKPSKLPGDVVKLGADVAKAGKDVVGFVHGALDHSNNNNSGGSGSGNGDQNPSGGGDGGTQPGLPPPPDWEVARAPSQGTEPHPSRPDGSQAPSSTTPLPYSTSPSSEYTAPASSAASNTGAGAAHAESDPSYVRPPTDPMDPPANTGAGREDGQPSYGMQMLSISSATPSSTTMGGAPSNDSGGGGNAHRKGFPLAAAAAIGSVLGFLVVSALFWAVYIYLRKRRRAFHAVYLPPKRMLSVTSGRTVSTVPLFISASEAGVKDENPFKHPFDVHEDDPFDAASLWRSSTARSESTLSV